MNETVTSAAYWAVGKDCCRERAWFNCGNAMQPGSGGRRSAFLVCFFWLPKVDVETSLINHQKL